MKCIVPALDQREIILLAAEHSARNANLDAIEADIKVHPTANKPEQTRSISRRFTALPGPKRERGNAVFKQLGETTRSLFEKEEEERKKDDSCEEKLAAHVRKDVGPLRRRRLRVVRRPARRRPRAQARLRD